MPADLTPNWKCRRGFHDWGPARRVQFIDLDAGEDTEVMTVPAHRCTVCKLYRLPVPMGT